MGAFNVAAGLIWSVDRVYYGKVRFDLLFLCDVLFCIFFALRGQLVPFTWTGWLLVRPSIGAVTEDNFHSSIDAEYLRAISH